jgi:hypothetical protein
MNDPINTYLHDHLAGAAYAIDLVEFMRDKHKDEELGRFASTLLAEIVQDRDTLRQIAERVGVTGSTLKELASWIGEKVGRIKLGYDSGSGLATLESLEFLALGIHGKLALWHSLAAVAPSDPRLAGTDFEQLAARAQSQHDKVEQRRRETARTALRPPQKQDQQREILRRALAADLPLARSENNLHGELVEALVGQAVSHDFRFVEGVREQCLRTLL